MMGIRWLIVALVSLIFAGCMSAQAPTPTSPTSAEPVATETRISTTPTVEPTALPSPTPEPLKPFFDVSDATLEHLIDPNCVDQFPQTVEAGKTNVLCFTFDNWVRGPVKLAGNYEMVIGAEGWVTQDGKDIPVLIPISAANRSAGKLWLNGKKNP